MENIDFDRALIAAAFDLIAERGWRRVTVIDAARRAGLSLETARERFPGRATILLKFGRLADMAALAEAPADAVALARSANIRDTLFGMMMRRIDVLQAHRDGMLALLRELPGDPATALMLTDATRRSMMWLLEGAGIADTGILGALRAKGLLAVWLWTVRAWRRDEGGDLATTMAALDNALRRAEQVEGLLPFGRTRRAPDEPIAPEAAEVPPPTPPQPPSPVPPTGDIPPVVPPVEELPPVVPPTPPDPPASPAF